MRRFRWTHDSITRRFALAIGVATGLALALDGLLTALSGEYARPALEATGLQFHTASILRVIDAAPPSSRSDLAKAAETPAFRVDWYDGEAAAILRDATALFRRHPSHLDVLSGGWPHQVAFFVSDDPALPVGLLRYDRLASPKVGFMAAALRDGSWLVLTASKRTWGMSAQARVPVRSAILFVSIALVSVLCARQLARPIEAFASAVRRFGVDPNAPPMAQQGPSELQVAIASFNAMQSQIQRLVLGQAAMFAAISHDLRTPLTRMRLRGEFIEDREQQVRLFKDVDEMRSMVDGALTFLRDNAAEETTTILDLPELLRTIVDDFADMGIEVVYSGPDHLPFAGRPVGLRRAFGNLVDNAAKYGVRPEITLRAGSDGALITISDQGPGVPEDKLETVFAPFQRVDPSRNRQTGGIGLGLTAARAGFRAHGGDVVLSNGETCGLIATVTLPLAGRGENVAR